MPTEKGQRDTKRLSKKALAHYVTILRDGDNFEKEKAIEALIASAGREVVQGIMPLLKEKNTSARMSVLDVLKSIGALHLESVIGMLDDDNEDIRVYGCEVLSFLKDPRSIPHILRKAGQDVDNVRNAACMALGEFDTEESVNALIEALKDEEWIAFSAILGLGKTKSPKAVPRLIEIFRTSGEELSCAACEVLLEYGDDDVLSDVFAVLRGWSQEKRGVYLRIILEMGKEDLLEKFKGKIGDELYEHLLENLNNNRHHSLDVIRMLSHFRTREACDTIMGILCRMEPDDEDYEPVLDVFASMSDTWVTLAEEYAKRGEKCLLATVRACKASSVAIDEQVLLAFFRSSPVEVKREIIRDIHAIVAGTGFSVIREAVGDIDGHVRSFAVEEIGRQGFTEFREDITRIVMNDFHDVRVKALKALVRMDPDGATDIIDHFVCNGNENDKKVYLAAAGLLSAENNFPFIKRLLKDNDEGVRRNAISVIGHFADDEKYTILIEEILMEDDTPHEALKVVKDKKLRHFRERLVAIFKGRDKNLWTRYYTLLALGAFRDPTLLEIFKEGLSDENGLIVIGCIRALADLDDSHSLQYVRPFLGSLNDDIRSAAESVINKT